VMMHVAPELVRPLSEAGNGRERRWAIAGIREGWAWAPRRWTQVSADTGTGNPAQASAAKGERYAELVASMVAQFLTELAACDPADLYVDE
jgi:creatinine amidohydrolase